MDLLTPSIGLLVWQAILFLWIILFIGSWVMILTDTRWDNQRKLIWLAAHILPAYFRSFASLARAKKIIAFFALPTATDLFFTNFYG